MAWNKKANLRGPRGAAGPSAALRIGSVFAGVKADAKVSGTSPLQTLDLVLPRGAQGLPGTNAVPADSAVAGYISTEGQSATKDALIGGFVGKDEIVVNVKKHGAVGDGVTDDTAAVQAAMDAIGLAGGGTMLFPPAEYSIHGTVVLVDNVKITGPGAVIRKKAPASNAVVFAGLAKNNLGYGGGVKNLVCEDIMFRGDLANGYAVCAFALHRASNVRIRKVVGWEIIINGHFIDLQGCENVVVDVADFAGRSPLGRAYTEVVQVDSSLKSGFSFPEHFWADEVCDGIPSRNITMKNTVCRPLTVDGVTYPAPSPFGSHSYVEGQYYDNIGFYNNTVSGVIAPQDADPYKGIVHFLAVRNLTMSGNTIDAQGVRNFGLILYRSADATPLSEVNNPASSSIRTSNPCTPKGVRVRDNTWSNFTDPDSGYSVVSILGDSSGTNVAEDVRVDGNDFFNNYPSGEVSSFQGPNSIQVTYARRVSITGNTGHRVRSVAYVANSSLVNVEKNTADYLGSYPIFLLNCNTTSTRGNQVSNSYARSIVDGGSGHIVSDNVTADIPSTGSNTGKAWDLLNVKRLGFSNNIMQKEGSFAAAVTVGGSSSHVSVKNNTIIGFATPVLVESPASATVASNIIS